MRTPAPKRGPHPRGPLSLFPPRTDPRAPRAAEKKASVGYRINGYLYSIILSRDPFPGYDQVVTLDGQDVFVRLVDIEQALPAEYLELACASEET